MDCNVVFDSSEDSLLILKLTAPRIQLPFPVQGRVRRTSPTQQDDTTNRLELDIVRMRTHVEVVISIFADSGETHDFTFDPLLIVHAIDPTQAIASSAKADHTTNPFSEFLNVVEAQGTGTPTRSLTLSTNEKIIPFQIPDIFGNKCVDHSRSVSHFRDHEVASDVNSGLHVEFIPRWTTITQVVLVIFHAGPPGSTDPGAVLNVINACFYDLQVTTGERERRNLFVIPPR